MHDLDETDIVGDLGDKYVYYQISMELYYGFVHPNLVSKKKNHKPMRTLKNILKKSCPKH